MAPPKAASWLRSRGSWDCRFGLWASGRRRGICCRLILRSLWNRCSRENALGFWLLALGFTNPMTIDEQHMRRALDLARAGVGLVSPNPAVGAVVVDASGREVGAGTHTYDGVKHAEVLALEQAGDAARGGSLYLNLEPCSHQGRTGPCADAVIAAGITRVICSMEDPKPRVAGQGLAKLRGSGIGVQVGLFEAEAKKLNGRFDKYIRVGQNF